MATIYEAGLAKVIGLRCTCITLIGDFIALFAAAALCGGEKHDLQLTGKNMV